MKTKLALFALCTQLWCCTTVTAPDGTTTKKFDLNALNSGVDSALRLGVLFGERRSLEPIEVTATK